MTSTLSRLLARNARGQGPLILMYHSVQAGRGPADWLWSVALERFTAQLDLLHSAGWQFRTVSELVRDPGGKADRVAVSFDDGYLDNLPAFEALAARGLAGTWFVVSDSVGGRAAWADEETRGWPMLDLARLRDMAEAGMEIGGHGRTHRRLAELPPEEVREEVAGCRGRLEDLLERPVTAFAYPYGSHDDAVVAAVREAGFRAACTTRAGSAWQDRDPLRLRRIAVYATDTLSHFARKLALTRNEAPWRRVAEHYLRSP